jgi:hypothetical protein
MRTAAGIIIAALLITGPCATCFVPNVFGHFCCGEGQDFLLRAADSADCFELTSRTAVGASKVTLAMPVPSTELHFSLPQRAPRVAISTISAPHTDHSSYLENCALLI